MTHNEESRIIHNNIDIGIGVDGDHKIIQDIEQYILKNRGLMRQKMMIVMTTMNPRLRGEISGANSSPFGVVVHDMYLMQYIASFLK